MSPCVAVQRIYLERWCVVKPERIIWCWTRFESSTLCTCYHFSFLYCFLLTPVSGCAELALKFTLFLFFFKGWHQEWRWEMPASVLGGCGHGWVKWSSILKCRLGARRLEKTPWYVQHIWSGYINCTREIPVSDGHTDKQPVSVVICVSFTYLHGVDFRFKLRNDSSQVWCVCHGVQNIKMA